MLSVIKYNVLSFKIQSKDCIFSSLIGLNNLLLSDIHKFDRKIQKTAGKVKCLLISGL